MERLKYGPDAEAFEEHYRDAKMYLFRAEQFQKDDQSDSVVFNVACVALENYLIALCHLYGVDPGNHNYICLMDAVETVVDVPPALNEEIRSLDLIFGICSIENYYHGVPEPSDAARVLAMCDGVQNLFSAEQMASVRAATRHADHV
ncbi:hypothetical protein GTO89_07805 [Heliobacterium gestii]|uniref:HEPN domain-containing protein n=1 Tax=Heliomicrobium gestii TaxID=2699 RepID=A0A845LDD1_HELGE|nr:hypothetical protein [Heliomicrobium gestii]MBM7866266.1 hypothetical protein [Heliomicrobium gestii]MZP42940.1 hypothetical protein [Heliomicrobium gestii]